jgi:hypothetical protein
MLKFEVPELTVKLPSAGLVEGVPAEVRLRAITGKEEMKMNSTSMAKYVDLVIDSCCTSLDKEIKFDVSKLTASDKIYLYVMLRSLSYGDSLSANYVCPNCKSVNITNIELSKLSVDYLTKEKLENLVVQLPVSNFLVELKVLNDAEIAEIDAEARKMSLKLKKSVVECKDLLVKISRIKTLTYVDDEEGEVVEENTPSNRSIFQMLVENLIGQDLAAIDEAWTAATNYGVHLYVGDKCTSCGEFTSVGVDVTSTEFFRPSKT